MSGFGTFFGLLMQKSIVVAYLVKGSLMGFREIILKRYGMQQQYLKKITRNQSIRVLN